MMIMAIVGINLLGISSIWPTRSTSWTRAIARPGTSVEPHTNIEDFLRGIS